MFLVKKDFVKRNMVLRAKFSNVNLDCFGQTTNSFLVLWHFGSVKPLE